MIYLMWVVSQTGVIEVDQQTDTADSTRQLVAMDGMPESMMNTDDLFCVYMNMCTVHCVYGKQCWTLVAY